MNVSAPFFFLHAPRTAGTTMNAILANNFAPEKVLTVYDAQAYETVASLTSQNVARYGLIQGHVCLDGYDPPTFRGQPVRVFAFVRDPARRVVSEYLFLKTWPGNHLYALLNEQKTSFRDYVTSEQRRLVCRGKNFMTRFFSGSLFPPLEYPEEALEQAKRNIKHHFICVGVTERFDESLLVLRELLGLQNVLYERRNALRMSAVEEITEEDLEIARECNRADQELYDYAYGLFEDRVKARGPGFKAAVADFQALNARFQKMCGLINQQNAEMHRSDIVLAKDLEGGAFQSGQGKHS